MPSLESVSSRWIKGGIVLENAEQLLHQVLSVCLLVTAFGLFLSGWSQLSHLHENAKRNLYEQHVVSCEVVG